MRVRVLALALVLSAAAAAGLLAHRRADDGLLMKSALFTWESVPEVATKVGGRRTVFAAPTATLDELEYHSTTLNPGQSPHPPHTHPNEEILIIKSGEVEAYVNGTWQRAPVGSLIFYATMVPHTVRNVGKVPATYHVVNWKAKSK
ncbi:hypothetical protein TBR22_A06460 [Luteitalea sp. TBR-22]|uniref:cupin domain-containing protein n=1 Tax=Luteitalea sp. TBR-22 TaxID=2802971 RepID=UPI001AFBFE3D|nr:cupin domain-containing protein [Luteitalea sp. TBR-22]BCS31445.1 hypothetical protein TBR22_A06460 [Luteitalea sp. TBR-22]